MSARAAKIIAESAARANSAPVEVAKESSQPVSSQFFNAESNLPPPPAYGATHSSVVVESGLPPPAYEDLPPPAYGATHSSVVVESELPPPAYKTDERPTISAYDAAPDAPVKANNTTNSRTVTQPARRQTMHQEHYYPSARNYSASQNRTINKFVHARQAERQTHLDREIKQIIKENQIRQIRTAIRNGVFDTPAVSNSLEQQQIIFVANLIMTSYMGTALKAVVHLYLQAAFNQMVKNSFAFSSNSASPFSMVVSSPRIMLLA